MIAAADKDVAMAPPPDPASSSTAPTPPQKSKETQEIHEKYRKLKRRFFELEEKHKETSTELQRSGERNVKMKEERNILLDRIIELESQPGVIAAAGSSSGSSSPPPSGAFPRSLITSRAQTSFAQNLREAAAEGDADAEIDPALVSRHAGSGAADDENASRRSPRRTRANKSKDGAEEAGASAVAGGETPVMVSSAGTRLRIRPVGGESPPADPAASPSTSSHPQSASNDAPTHRSISPDSGGMPVDDDNDESGEYSPPPKSNKRARDSTEFPNGAAEALVAVSPEPKAPAPRRSSRRSGGAPAVSAPASRTRVIQQSKRAAAPKAAASGPAPEEGAPAPQPGSPKQDSDSANTNGHGNNRSAQDNTNNNAAASSSSSPAAARPPSLAFNPYYPYLGPSTPMTPNTPYPYGNPYAYYMGPPMPGGPMPYMPPPNFAPPPAQRPPAEAPRAAKPKRLKAHTVTSKSYSIPMVPRDKKGKPMLPLNVGIMTVINLGDVCMREHFHTERYIFPVGYEVTRRYLSTVDQNVEVVYHCTILDGGDGPKFQIIPSDVPDRPVIAGTATGAWSNIVKQANAIRNRQHSNSVSGPDFFGLGQNTIKHLIQELPNADRLRDYVWQHFVEGGPLGGRHAAVIPALPEEYDAALPIGPYYPPRQQRDPSNQPESPKVSHYPPHILAQAAAAKRASPQQPFAPHPPQQQNYNDGGRPVLPPTPTSGGGSYYLPHTQQQSSSGSPGAGGGASRGVEYPAEDGPNGPSTFASIMNAFPTQEDGASNGGGSGGPGS